MNPEVSSRIIVTGGTSLIGKYLLPQLVKSGFRVCALTRGHRVSHIQEIVWEQRNIAVASTLETLNCASVLIHLAPLPLLPPLINTFAKKGVKRIIAFGTTSRFTKADSANPAERVYVKKLIDAEQQLEIECQKNGIKWTLFRPTIIYDVEYPNGNKIKYPQFIGGLNAIAKFIRYLGFFPLCGGGEGLRQPVHAEDLALACLQALGSKNSGNRAYNLSGGETISYQEMIARMFASLKKAEHFIALPNFLIFMCVKFIRFLPAYRNITMEMLHRMNKNMDFDHQSASEDFSYSPRRFLQE